MQVLKKGGQNVAEEKGEKVKSPQKHTPATNITLSKSETFFFDIMRWIPVAFVNMKEVLVIIVIACYISYIISLLQGAIVGAVAGLSFSMWIAIGSSLAGSHRQILPTSVQNCSFPANYTLRPDPTNP